jgi:hypothetical protein
LFQLFTEAVPAYFRNEELLAIQLFTEAVPAYFQKEEFLALH